MWKNRKAQSTVEYAVLIAVVAGALLAMQIYMKRGAMGKLRSSTDQIGDQFTPLNYTSTFSNEFDVVRKETLTPVGVSESKITTDETTKHGTSAAGGKGAEHVEATLTAETLYK